MIKQRLIFVGLVLALLSMGIFIYQRYRVAPSLLLPEIQLSDLQGNSVKPASGKPTLLIFFGTWCRDCRKQLPVLAKLEAELKNKNIQVILVSDEENAVLQDFSSSIPLSFQLCKLKGSFKENNIIRAFDICPGKTLQYALLSEILQFLPLIYTMACSSCPLFRFAGLNISQHGLI